jgi:hypothetical protein
VTFVCEKREKKTTHILQEKFKKFVLNKMKYNIGGAAM